jgi:hypothetical protein
LFSCAFLSFDFFLVSCFFASCFFSWFRLSGLRSFLHPFFPFCLLALSAPFVDHTCSYIQPNNRIEVVLFVAIFSALVSTPVALLADWMINHILAAPVLEECNKSTVGGKKEEERNSNLLAISPASVAPAASREERESSFFPIVPLQQQQQRQSKRMSFAFIRQSFLRRNTTVMKSAFSKYEGIVIQEIVSLKKELIAYRNSSKDSSHQEELDCKFHIFLCFYEHLLNFAVVYSVFCF